MQNLILPLGGSIEVWKSIGIFWVSLVSINVEDESCNKVIIPRAEVWTLQWAVIELQPFMLGSGFLAAAIGEPLGTLIWPARPAGRGEPEAAVRPGDSCKTDTRGRPFTNSLDGQYRTKKRNLMWHHLRLLLLLAWLAASLTKTGEEKGYSDVVQNSSETFVHFNERYWTQMDTSKISVPKSKLEFSRKCFAHIKIWVKR